MTDVRELRVVLTEDLREDSPYLAAVVAAVEQFRGVAAVHPADGVTGTDLLAREHVSATLRQEMHDAVDLVFRETPT